MIQEVRLPEIAENVTTGDVVKVMVSAGDSVDVDQSLIELETDKAVFEVPSTAKGVVSEISVKEGDTIEVGQVIARIDTEGGGKGDTSGGKEEEEKESAKASEKKSKDDDTEDQPRKSRDEKAASGDDDAKEKAESGKKDDDKKSASGKKDEDEKTGDRKKQKGAEKESAGKSGDDDGKAEPASEASKPAPASPTVRRLARELGIDIHDVKGTGPGGRISAADVQSHAKSIITASATASAPAASTVELPDFSRFGDVERVKMSKVRSITARNMAAAWNSVPHVTQHDEADITDLETARKRYGKLAEDAGGKMTMTSILLKVCGSALKRFPDFNASVDVANGEIVYKKYVNIGVAVDTDRGLLVPVIKDVDRKNIVELSVEVSDVAARARDKKITPSDLEGGNFTISNLGGIGGTSFTPIVYAPEVAILGVSRAKMQQVFQDGEFVPRQMMPLSLSYDHRVIDGAAAARFLRWVCEALEDPILIAVDG